MSLDHDFAIFMNVMLYRLIIFILIFSACQRKSVQEKSLIIQEDIVIDTSLTMYTDEELPKSALDDIHHLLELGFKEANRKYDTLRFKMYFDPKLDDSIRLKSTGERTIFLTIGNDNNKVVALYSYLDLLGYRFYGPEDHWTYIPELKEFEAIDTTIVSFFSLRKLIPSFGASRPGINILDTTGTLYKRWMNRLRMANLYDVKAGHYGTTFNNKYKDLIIENPEWRGKDDDGKYRKWSSTLKLCYSLPDVIALYKKDAHIRLERLKKNSSPPYFLTIDPPDGGGFCSCNNCGTPSDQVYGLANEVAKYLYSIDTNTFVTLYGYNQHANPPSFSLEENIVVGIVPNAFQQVGSSTKMMNLWQETGAQLYLRDYISIPVWQYDKPSFDPYGNFMSQIETIKNNNYIGYHYETTASFMSVGLKFYLLSIASWRNIDAINEYELFLHTMFPNIENQMSLIYGNLPTVDIYTYFDALSRVRSMLETSSSNSDIDITNRLLDLEFYIEYLYLLDKYERDETDQNLNTLLNKILSLPGSRLLHPYGLYRTLNEKSKVSHPLERTNNINIQIDSGNNDLQFELRRKKEKKYIAMYPDFYLDSVNSFIPIPIRNENGIVYIGEYKNGLLVFNARLKPLNANAGGSIIFRDMNNNYINEINLKPDNKMKRIELKLEPNQFYNIYFRTPGSEIYFQGPNRPFVFSKKLKPRYTYNLVSYYFKIPEEIEEAIIRIPRHSNEVVVRTEQGIISKTKEYAPYNITIKDHENEIIEIQMYRNGVGLLNIPQLIALHKKGVIYAH